MAANDIVQLTSTSIRHGHGMEMEVSFNGRCISISMFSVKSVQGTQPLENELLSRIEEEFGNPDSGNGAALKAALDTIVDAGRFLFAQLPPPPPMTDILHDKLLPKVDYFLFRQTNSVPAVTPIDYRESYYGAQSASERPNASEPELDADLPQFSTKDIRTLQPMNHSRGTVKALLPDGRQVLCKACADYKRHSSRRYSILQEMARLKTIRDAHDDPGQAFRVPKILGSVKDPDNDKCVGYVREHIPGECLYFMDVSQVSPERKKKWVAQLDDSVHRLGEIGVSWTAGFAINVTIDDDDNAWFTRLMNNGVPTPENTTTMGIKQFLGLDEEPEDGTAGL